MKTIAKKERNTLISNDFFRLKDGYYTVEVKRVRSLEQHRKLFALMEIYMEASGRFKTVEECLIITKIALGYVKEIEYKGKTYVVPDSISFENMGQDEFNIFFDRVVELYAADLRVTKEELLEQ